ncbi:MAG: hypothetical protein AB7L84_14370 [Acidimicrobiia bacterium]
MSTTRRRRVEPFTFEWDGEIYQCPDPWSLDPGRVLALARRSPGDAPLEALRVLLGPDQYQRLMAGKQAFTIVHLCALLDGWIGHHGLVLPGWSNRREG